MFQAKASKERLDVVKSLMAYKLKPRAFICAFVLEMKWYFDRLESLNMGFDTELSVNIILSGLPADYNQFVLSYQMNRKETLIMKLHRLLQTAEQGIKKSDLPSTSATPVLTVGHNAKEGKTSHSNWKGKATQGKSDRGLRERLNLRLHLEVIQRKQCASTATQRGIGSVAAQKMIRNVILFHALFKDGYQFSFDNENGDILVYSNCYFRFKASPCKGIYENVECISNDGNMILNVGSSNELDESKLWHSRLGHIIKKRIAQLQKDRVLESFDFKSDDLTPHRTPQLNGVAERRNRTLLDMMVGCKWIFKKKTDMDGKVHTYKARLVAKGYTQTHEIDYEETFSPVAKIKSIRIMLAIAAFHDYEIWQMDRVKASKGHYGLKEASRSWNLCFHEKVTQFGFSRSEDESGVYVKVSGSVVVFLVLYVDDTLLIGNDISMLESVKDWLGRCFAMKDLGDAANIFGIKIDRDRAKRLIGLSQDTYLDKILKRLRMENFKKRNLPLHHGINMSKDLCPKTDDDLNKMSLENSGEGHLIAVKNILRYLRNTKDRFFVYGGEKELRVTGYCNAGWETNKDDSRSQSGLGILTE
nr:hypothetical protein [Tanacetum cinerariifolium]